jgi:hypothetical protein
MRGSDDTREGYITLASRVEQEFRLPEMFTEPAVLGWRDTFPFEERRYLSRLQTLTKSGDLTEARTVVSQRRASVWRQLPERALLWKLAERCLDFLAAAQAWTARAPGSNTSATGWVEAYKAADGLWQVDRHQRLMEQNAAACAENIEVAGLIDLCRKRYRQVAEAAQWHFLDAMQRDGWPPEGVFRQTQTFDRHVAPVLGERGKVAYFLVDAMHATSSRTASRNSAAGAGSTPAWSMPRSSPASTPVSGPRTRSFIRDETLARSVKKAVGYACQNCGDTLDDAWMARRFVHAHHMDPLSERGKDEAENLIVLCPSCHAKIHTKMLKIERHEDGLYVTQGDGEPRALLRSDEPKARAELRKEVAFRQILELFGRLGPERRSEVLKLLSKRAAEKA